MEKMLDPIVDLKKNGDQWTSIGADPQFFLPVNVRAKYIRIMFSGKLIDAKDGDLAKIYLDYGSGFTEANSEAFVLNGPNFQVDALIEIKRPLKAIRFDPLERPGNFTISRFAVIPQKRRSLSAIRDFRPLFSPMNQVELIKGNLWRSLGNDPYFHMGVTTNASALYIKLHIKVKDKSKIARRSKTQIFFDFGIGYNEENSHTIHSTGPELNAQFTVQTHGPVRGIRFDPIDRECEFEILSFQVREISLLAHQASIRAELSRYALAAKGTKGLKILATAAVGKQEAVQYVFDEYRAANGMPDAYDWWITSRGQPDKNLFSSFVDESVKFSIVLPTYNPPMEFFAKAVKSILGQTYTNWELCIVDDGSKEHQELRSYIEKIGDSRIKLKILPQNVGISGASNEAVKMATGDFIALLDQDDEIASHALSAMAIAIKKNPEVDWLYSDEDKIDIKGKRANPYFKPDWSPAFFLSCMYTCHLGVYRRSVVESVGGFRTEYDFAQDFDLALRVSRVARKIVHVSDILYHWRTLPESTASGADAKPTAELKAKAALQEFLDSGKYSGRIEDGFMRGMHRASFDIVGSPLVSIAIPSAGSSFIDEKGKHYFVLDLVKSIREKSTYRDIEIVVADNNDFDPALTKALKALDVLIVHYQFEQFNLAEKMNFVVDAVTGRFVVIMNDDMTVINPDWVEQMLMWCQQDDVAGVGAKLIFPDGKIQHAGVLMLGQGPSHPYYLHEEKSEVGLIGNAVSAHEASAVTGACMMVRKEDYQAVGGFDPAFRINYNDVDFCMRLRAETGKRIVWTPHARIYHYESVSREEPPKGELEALEKRWGFGADIYYNRHLSQFSNSYEIGLDVASINDDYEIEAACL